jgi:hypothetical protein
MPLCEMEASPDRHRQPAEMRANYSERPTLDQGILGDPEASSVELERRVAVSGRDEGEALGACLGIMLDASEVEPLGTCVGACVTPALGPCDGAGG